MDAEIEAMKNSFLDELSDSLSELENLILSLSDEARSQNSMILIHRRIHSIKGVAGSYSLQAISNICHRFEDQLKLAEAQESSAETRIEFYLKFIDELRSTTDSLRQGGEVEPSKTDEEHSDDSDNLYGASITTVRLTPPKILIIESSQTLIRAIVRTLKDYLVDFSVAESGYEGFGRLLHFQYDWIITGIRVDPLDGLSLSHSLRTAASPNIKTPITILSSDRGHENEASPPWNETILKSKSFQEEIFSLFLKRFPNSRKIDEPKPTPVMVSAEQLKSILLIDDSKEIHSLVKLSLKSLKTTDFFSAFGGREGIEMAKQKKPEVILLDYMMPDVDGPEVFAALRKIPQLAKTKIIFLTARDTEQERNELIKLGAKGIIQKPFSPKLFSKQLEGILNT